MDATAEPKRHRGGQPGNTNALKHGLYARARLTAHTLELLEIARRDGHIDDDIDILRVEIARLLEAGDYDRFMLAALARAVIQGELARHRITGGAQRDQMMAALDAVLADVNRQLPDA